MLDFAAFCFVIQCDAVEILSRRRALSGTATLVTYVRLRNSYAIEKSAWCDAAPHRNGLEACSAAHQSNCFYGRLMPWLFARHGQATGGGGRKIEIGRLKIPRSLWHQTSKNGCHQFAEPVGLRCIMHQKPLAVNWRRSQICVVLRPPPPTPPTPHPRPQLLRLHWAFLLHPTLLHAASVAPATVYGPQMMCRNVAVKRMRTATKYYPLPTPYPPPKAAAVSTVFAATHEGNVLMGKCGIHKQRLKHKWTATQADTTIVVLIDWWLAGCMTWRMDSFM